ncbi:MAG TPA: hypothetical protein VH170_07590 [Chthoniobacterales bacterium]|jgi:hypothetical protein|nr:hypothetical protein [Chthoniobacterales bacterium]
MKLNSRSKQTAEGLIVVLILAVILLGIGWYLYSTKAATDKECRVFGHDIINRLMVNHDPLVLDNELSPEMKLKFPPSAKQLTIQHLNQLGAPQQPIRIEDNVTFDSTFFGLISYAPHGFFTAHLDYPGQSLLLQIAVSHPQTKWQVDDITGPAPAPRTQ